MVNRMDMELYLIKLEIDLRANLSMVINMVMESSLILTEFNMMDCGKMVIKMALAQLLILMVMLNGEIILMENFLYNKIYDKYIFHII